MSYNNHLDLNVTQWSLVVIYSCHVRIQGLLQAKYVENVVYIVGQNKCRRRSFCAQLSITSVLFAYCIIIMLLIKLSTTQKSLYRLCVTLWSVQLGQSRLLKQNRMFNKKCTGLVIVQTYIGIVRTGDFLFLCITTFYILHNMERRAVSLRQLSSLFRCSTKWCTACYLLQKLFRVLLQSGFSFQFGAQLVGCVAQ